MTDTKTDRRSLILGAAALLVEYPDDAFIAQLPLLQAIAARLSAPSAERLRRSVDRFTATPLGELQRDYVATFDLQRRHCLYLTYYAYGDTRKRGMALLRFTQAYREAGAEKVSTELADHLSVVCEFAAAHPRPGIELLTEHRVTIDLLARALGETDSPWCEAIELVRDALPPASDADIERAIALAQGGPPAEHVGLEPFAPPEYMGARR